MPRNGAVPARANRSNGTAAEYVQLMLRGHRLEDIGGAFGVSGSAVRKALKAASLPTNSRKLLACIPEGCTPTDADVLRAANHALAQENTELKAKLEAIKRSVALLKALA